MSSFSERVRSLRGSIRTSVVVSIVIGIIVPVFLWAEAPAWWAQRGVLNPEATPDDYAAANQGQVKHIAKQAYEEMVAKLPGGAGSTLDIIWATPAVSTDDYQTINLGQLKNVAKPFYDRLITMDWIEGYPWTSSVAPADDYALANIGQVKNLFSFDLLSLWLAHNLPAGASPDEDADGDGKTNRQEFFAHTSPSDFYNGGTPVITIISGHSQEGAAGQYLPQPVVILVKNSDGTPLVNAPVEFRVPADSGSIASTPNDSNPGTSITVRTLADGTVSIYWKLSEDTLENPGTGGLEVIAGGTGSSTSVSVTANVTSSVSSPPILPYAVIRLMPGLPDNSKFIASKVTNSGKVLISFQDKSWRQGGLADLLAGYRWSNGSLTALSVPLVESDVLDNLNGGTLSQSNYFAYLNDMNESGEVVGGRNYHFQYTNDDDWTNTYDSYLPFYWGANTTLGARLELGPWEKNVFGFYAMNASRIKNNGGITGGFSNYNISDGLKWSTPQSAPERLGTGSFFDDEGSNFNLQHYRYFYPDSGGVGDGIEVNSDFRFWGSLVTSLTYMVSGKVFDSAVDLETDSECFVPTSVSPSGRYVGYIQIVDDSVMYREEVVYWGDAQNDPAPLDTDGQLLAINAIHNVLTYGLLGSDIRLWRWEIPPASSAGVTPSPIYVRYKPILSSDWAINMAGSSLNDTNSFVGQATKILNPDGTPIPSPKPEPVLFMPAELVVDANRDGELTPAHASSDPFKFDITSPTKHFRFWSNDDIDRLHTFDDSAADSMDDIDETEEDDIGPEEVGSKNWLADWEDNIANSRRDLEDFNRLVINVGGLDEAFKNGTLHLGLKWAETNGTTPSIKLYKQFKPGGDLSYLTSDYDAAMQIVEPAVINAMYPNEVPATTNRTKIDGTETFVLPTSLWAGLPAGSIKRNFLFEVCTPGKGQLKIVILKKENGTYTEIGEGPGVWFDFKKIGDMYEHWSVGNANGGPPDAVAGRLPSLTGSGTTFSYDNPTPSPEERKYILFVHGWNMERWEKERFAETAYKRLWWQGYKGRFGLFTWPCTNRFDETEHPQKLFEVVGDGTHFDRGEWTAWRSGAPLRQLLQTLNGAYNGQLFVFSHSMGGITMSEALRLQSDSGGGQITNVYVASQAALSAHLYDGTLSTAAGSASTVQWTYDHPSFPLAGALNFGPQTPNIYRNWLAYILAGSATSSKAVGTLVNFYNQNDWALAAPVWQFNQIAKPDWPDVFHSQPWTYYYNADPNVFSDAFRKTYADNGVTSESLHLGTRTDPQDRHEIMAFAAESYVKSFGATPNVSQGVTRSFDVRSIWPADSGDHKAHLWHSGQFRSHMPKQKDYWKALLGRQAFDITTGVLP